MYVYLIKDIFEFSSAICKFQQKCTSIVLLMLLLLLLFTCTSDIVKCGRTLIKKFYFLKRPRPHFTVFKRKRYCFVPDTATVHTTTPKTISENRSFRKRSLEWNDLKPVLFENAVFLVWTAKTMLSKNDDVTTTTPPGCRPLNREYTR